jgi:hypothetical protein
MFSSSELEHREAQQPFISLLQVITLFCSRKMRE